MTDEKKSLFDLDEFNKFSGFWHARQKELQKRNSYYNGSVYHDETMKLFYKSLPQIVGQIKPIYLFLARAVDVDAGIIPAGWDFPEEAPPDWEAARDLVFSWSRWTTEGVLYADYGSRLGLVGLRISDPAEDRVVIQPVDPLLFMLVQPNPYDENIEMSIYIDYRTGEDGEKFEYAEVITSETIRTFRNGVPWAFDDERGFEWGNEYGFVPFVEVKNKLNGDPFSEATFQRQIPAMDQLNELATELAEVIKENQDPQVVITGADATDLQRGKDTVWFLPEGADVKMIIPGINIEGTLKFIQDIKNEIKESLPELSFDALKDASNIATETLEVKLTELVLKIKRVRPNYDSGLVHALQLAARAAKVKGIFGLEALDDPELTFDPDREILPMDPGALLDLELKRQAVEMGEAMKRAPVEDN